MIICLADGYFKALEVLTELTGAKWRAINIATDAVTYTMNPIVSGDVAVTYFPRHCREYGAGIFSIATYTNYQEKSYAELLSEQFSGNGTFEKVEWAA